MNNYLYTEYPQSDRPTQVDPIELDSSVHCHQETHRITVQLMRWALPKVAAWAAKGNDTYEWENCLGCDCSFLVESIRGVRHKDRWLYKIDESEIIDAIIYVSEGGWTKMQPIYKGEKPDTFMPDYEDTDWIIVCRPFEQSLGHGVRWLEISVEQAKRLLQKYADACPTTS